MDIRRDNNFQQFNMDANFTYFLQNFRNFAKIYAYRIFYYLFIQLNDFCQNMHFTLNNCRQNHNV